MGCKQQTLSESSLVTIVGARKVTAVIDGPAFIQTLGESAVISGSVGKILVEPDRVTMDGAELAKIPVAATNVEVKISSGMLSVTADGASVANRKLSK